MKFVKLLVLVISALTSTALGALEENTEPPENRAYQLLELAADHEFTIQGIENTDLYDYRPVQGTMESRIRQLLTEFNYVLVRSDQGKVERLIILDEKPLGPKPIIVSTQKQGHQHILNASIKGIGDDWMSFNFLVDTGAERVVLPYSVIEALGYEADKLENRKLQTVNGIVDAKIGQLEAIDIGNEIIRDVGVAFIEDSLLGNNKLLGMNVLSRFRFTIDNELQEITFKKKIP